MEYQEFVKKDILETTIPKHVGYSGPTMFKEDVFNLEFMSEHTGKPPPRISIFFYTNMLLMIQVPTLEFEPMPVHFKYHLPFKDQFHAV